jgi:hypothetical protein
MADFWGALMSAKADVIARTKKSAKTRRVVRGFAEPAEG